MTAKAKSMHASTSDPICEAKSNMCASVLREAADTSSRGARRAFVSDRPVPTGDADGKFRGSAEL